MNSDLQLLPGLPPFEGGRMSDFPYHAGTGRHGIFNGGQPRRYQWSTEDASLVYSRYLAYAGYERFESGEGEPAILSNGFSEFTALQEGSSLTLTQTRAAYPIDPPIWGRAVTETTQSAFEQYVDALLADGFRCVWENRIEQNIFLALARDGRRIHASYYPAENTARFIDDSLSDPIECFGGGTSAGVRPVLCQFALHYGPMIPHVTADCGMLYFLKLPDNSIFLIDGGEIGQATDAACGEVMRLMRSLTGTPEGEKIRIAAWLCTHAHDDHMDLFSKLLRFHHDELTLERAIFNFPHHEQYGLMVQSYVMMERLHRYFPDAKYLKAHTGQRFTLAGVDFEILLTHEDWMAETGREYSHDLNDTSLVVKISFDGASFLLLGDINRPAEARLLSHFTAETLRCNAMQAAHHLINQLPDLYPVIQPEIALVPQHFCSAVETNPNYRVLCDTVSPQNQHYASCATELFEFRDGRLVLTKRLFPCGDIFDHSQV